MVKQLVVKGVFETNTYFYIDEKTGHGFLIDPGAQADKLLQIIQKNNWTIEKILLTHGHFDHTGAVDHIHHELQIPYYIHENGVKYLEDTNWNLSSYRERNVQLKQAQYLLDGQQIRLSVNQEMSLQVIETPGHTNDSVVFYSLHDRIAFVGDTIFMGSIGSTQYPGSSARNLENSILNKIFCLPEDIILYSGHSAWTTVGTEKARYRK